MSIKIFKAGICDTIQDHGRVGYAAFGINPAGVMDKLAMQIANALVANELHAAVLEMHFPAPVLRFNQAAVIALSGADFDAIIQDENNDSEISLPVNKTVFIAAGSSLIFKNKLVGERCYFAVKGGFDLNPWLGSFSTNLKIKEAGFFGRILKKGELLPLKKISAFYQNTFIYPWAANMQTWYDGATAFNFLPGPEWDWLDAYSQKNFLQKLFTIALHSDRMGIGLEGNTLQANHAEQLVSSGVNFGTIQLLPNGNLVLLAADHPTTGGYPRIANIISVHLPKLAQAAPGTKIRLLQTTLENAEDLLVQMHKELLQLKQAVKFRLPHF